MCSKMSQLHAELTQQAAELGFMSIEEAERAGYKVDWINSRLVKAEDAEKAKRASSPSDDILGLHELPVHAADMFKALDAWAEDGLDEAHKAWLEERDEVLDGLESCLETNKCGMACDINIERAIYFIKERCRD